MHAVHWQLFRFKGISQLFVHPSVLCLSRKGGNSRTTKPKMNLNEFHAKKRSTFPSNVATKCGAHKKKLHPRFKKKCMDIQVKMLLQEEHNRILTVFWYPRVLLVWWSNANLYSVLCVANNCSPRGKPGPWRVEIRLTTA